MTPEEEMKKELESKYVSENAQQAAPAPLTVQQLQKLYIRPTPSNDVWRKIILSPTLRTVVPSSEGAVVPATPCVIEEGFGLNDFINFGKVSRSFSALIREPEIQNHMRAFASVLPRFVPMQQAYLASQRLINRMANRQLTLKEAVANIVPNRLPKQSTLYGAVSVTTKETAVGLGVSPAEIQDDWFSREHVEALQAGIPFEEIEHLTTYQVQAMLATRNVDNVRPLTREDVISSNLGAEHIEALKKGSSFESIKKLSVPHLKALSDGFSEEDIQPLNTVQVNMLLHGLSVKDLTSSDFLQWFEKVKYSSNNEYLINQLLSKGYAPEQIIKLNLDQLEALGNYHGDHFTLAEVTNPIFVKLCQENKKNDGGYEVRSEIRAALRAGYSLEDIANLNPLQLNFLSKGNTIEQVQDPVFVKLHLKFGEQFRWIIQKLLKQGVKPKEIAALTRLQLCALENDDAELTLEKVRHPRFSEAAHYAIMIAGYDFETVINLERWQHYLLVAGVSLEKVEACKFNRNFTLAHVKAVQAGANFDDIESLNYAALQHYLAMPCCDLPQQPLAFRVARVESKDDSFSPVVMHAYSGEGLRSAFVDPADVDLYFSGGENEEKRARRSPGREQPH